jgi:hypothetical protein
MRYIKPFSDYNYIKESVNFSSDQVWYTGSKSEIKEFTLDYLSRENTDQHGPGIYLSNDKDDSKGYGKYIHITNFNPTGEVIIKDDEIDYNDSDKAKQIIKEHCDEWELDAQNYAQDPYEGLNNFIRDTMDRATDRLDFFEYVWYGFFINSPKDFVEGMASVGIDGAIVQGYSEESEIAHLIVYNLDALSITKLEIVED